MKKISRYAAIFVMASFTFPACQSRVESDVIDFIPENAPLVVVTNPGHILSQTGLAENPRLLEEFDTVGDILQFPEEYGLDTDQDIFFFFINEDRYGAITKLKDPEEFLVAVEEEMEIEADLENQCYYEECGGFKIYDDVLLAVYDEYADADGMSRIIEKLYSRKGKNKVNSNDYFKAMLEEPSLIGCWVNFSSVQELLEEMGEDEWSELMDTFGHLYNEEGALYLTLRSSEGQLSLDLGGDYLAQDWLDMFDAYGKDHLDYIPADAPLVAGFNMPGGALTDIIKSIPLAKKFDSLSHYVDMDIMDYLAALDGDMTISIDQLEWSGKGFSMIPDIKATILVDINDRKLYADALEELDHSLKPLSKSAGEDAYEIFLNQMGTLNYGLDNKSLYINLGNKGFGKADEAFSVDDLDRNTFGFLSLRSKNISRKIWNLLEEECEMELDWIKGIEMRSVKDGKGIKCSCVVLTDDGVRPLEALIEQFM